MTIRTRTYKNLFTSQLQMRRVLFAFYLYGICTNGTNSCILCNFFRHDALCRTFAFEFKFKGQPAVSFSKLTHFIEKNETQCSEERGGSPPDKAARE